MDSDEHDCIVHHEVRPTVEQVEAASEEQLRTDPFFRMIGKGMPELTGATNFLDLYSENTSVANNFLLNAKEKGPNEANLHDFSDLALAHMIPSILSPAGSRKVLGWPLPKAKHYDLKDYCGANWPRTKNSLWFHRDHRRVALPFVIDLFRSSDEDKPGLVVIGNLTEPDDL